MRDTLQTTTEAEQTISEAVGDYYYKFDLEFIIAQIPDLEDLSFPEKGKIIEILHGMDAAISNSARTYMVTYESWKDRLEDCQRRLQSYELLSEFLKRPDEAEDALAKYTKISLQRKLRRGEQRILGYARLTPVCKNALDAYEQLQVISRTRAYQNMMQLYVSEDGGAQRITAVPPASGIRDVTSKIRFAVSRASQITFSQTSRSKK